MTAMSTQDPEIAQKSTEEPDGTRQRELYAARGLPADHPDYCTGSGPTTHINGYFNNKILYLVKKADFDKAAFAALQSEEEQLQYFEARVDIIRDDPRHDS